MTKAHENFIRLAEARTNKALRAIDLIGNLSNTSNYSYSEEDVRRIVTALKKKVRDVEQRFEVQVAKQDNEEFKL